MRQFLITLFFSFLTVVTSAQTGGSIMDKIDPNFLNKDLLYDKGTYASFDGNPYLFENPKEACLLLSDGKELCDVKVNYDAFESSFLLQEDNEEDVSYVDPKFIKSFTAEGFKYIKSTINGLDHKGFYQVVYESKNFSLFLVKNVELKYRDNQGNTGYSSTDKNSKYFSIDEIFVFVSDDDILVEKNLKKLLKDVDYFDYKEAKKFSKSKNLDMKSDVDIASLMNFLDKN